MSKKGTVYTQKTVFVEDFDRSTPLKFNFKIERILYQRGSFVIAAIDVTWNDQRILFPQNRSTVLGDILDPRVGDTFSGEGLVEKSVKHGYSIRLKKAPDVYTPRTKQEITDFLVSQISGIGVKKAASIFDHFGEDTIQILQAAPERVKEVGVPVSDKVVEAIRERLVDGMVLNKVFSVLNLLGLREGLAIELYDKYKAKTYDELLSNPYILAEVNPLYWRQADSFYFSQLSQNKKLPNLVEFSANPARYRTAVKYFLKLKVELSGSLAYPLDELVEIFTKGDFLERASRFGSNSAKITETQLTSLLNELEKEGDIVKTKSKVSGKVFVYLQNSYLAETNIVKLIKNFNRNSFKKSTKVELDEFLKIYQDRNGFSLAENQKLAVDLLANNKISILTGGPGSGKTTTVKAVKEFIDYLGEIGTLNSPSVALLAPTGKAAKRLSEVLDYPASTIHRKLKIKGFGRDDALKKIDEDFVIVDESSMIDVYLFSQLLESLSPNSNLLLVGDENQLPSVGAGLILRDLIESKKVATVTLNKVFRQADGSRLVYNAHLMKDGIGVRKDDNGLIFNETPNSGLGDSYFVKTSSILASKQSVIKSYKRFLDLGFDYSDILVLSAQKRGELGTLNLNREIQKTFDKSDFDDVLIRKQDNSAFYVGDPVIQLVNDYDNNVFNGETGVVTDIVTQGTKRTLVVTFEGDTVDEDRVVEYSGYSIYNIDLAYAITYHKSQGSEAKVVIQVVDSSQKRMLNRSLVYTGYTRTRDVNVIIGQTDSLNDALSDISNLERVSLIKERL